MTKRQAFKKTLKRWEEKAQSGDSADDNCGFCEYRDEHLDGSCGGNCPHAQATGKRCGEVKVYRNWFEAETVKEHRRWARAVVAYLKRLGKREGWDK